MTRKEVIYSYLSLLSYINYNVINYKQKRGLGGRDRMVVGFTTTYAINAYQH